MTDRPTLARSSIAQYKDGYRVVAEALAGATDAELDARPAPGKWTRARDRASSRRQRDDVGDPPAAARRDRTGRRSPATTRSEFARRLYYDRPIEASLEAFKAARRTTAEILERMTRGGVGARGHAHRTRAVHRRALARDLRRARAQPRRADPRRARRREDVSDRSAALRPPTSRRAQYSRNRFAQLRRTRATPAPTSAAISRAGIAGLDLLAQRRTIRRGCRSAASSCSYSYGGSRQAKRSGSAARNAAISATPVSTGRNARAIEHVDLAAAAARLRVLVERRLEDRRPEVDARQLERVHRRRQTARRRPTARRPARTAASCRALPTRSCLRTAPCPDRRSPCRASACSATASPTAAPVVVVSTSSRRQPSIATTSRSAPMPKCSLNSRASSPIVMPCRIGIGYRPTNDSNPRTSIGPSTASPPIGFGPVADDRP